MAPSEARPSRLSRGQLTGVATPVVGQYSVQKFLDLQDFTQQASTWRALWIQVSLPLPGLVAALLPALIPLEPLRIGVTTAFLAHLFSIVVCITWGSIVLVLSISRVPASVYSQKEILAVTLLCAIIQTALVAQICLSWRFPVPFTWVGGSTVWTFSLGLAHLIVLRSKCWRETQLLAAVKQNQAGVCLEVTQVVLYPAISIVFDRVGQTYQILITLAFPLIKLVLKRAIQKSTTSIIDQHGLVVVSAIEICSSLYQSIIMQSAPSKVAMAIIMGVDFIQGLFAIRYFLDRPTHGLASQRELLPKAYELLQTHRAPTSCAIVLNPTAIVPVPTNVLSTTAASTSPRLPKATLSGSEKAIVQEALQLAYAAETIVLLEYYEVIVPLLNCVFIVVAMQFQAALYNTKLRGFNLDAGKLSGAVTSILLYSLLQGLSCVAMHLVMKYRYGVSASSLLAFVLERYKRAIQAKMIAWLPLILHFSTVHYGTDFSFQFTFNKWVQWCYQNSPDSYAQHGCTIPGSWNAVRIGARLAAVGENHTSMKLRATQARPARRAQGPTTATVAPVAGKYSVQKFLELHDYTQRSSPWRAFWIHVTIFIPGLLAALLPGLLPLQPLHCGATTAFLAHVFFIMVFITWGSIVPVLAISQIPPSIYSDREARAITLLCGVIHTAFVSQITTSWRFPIPMMWVTGSIVWTLSLGLAHLVVLRSKCWREAQLLNGLKTNQAGLSLEVLQVILYPAVSILFDRVGQTYQVLITLAFPVIKFGLKRAIQSLTRHLEDQHGLVVVSAIEICSSLYQSIIMQSAPSKVAMAIIMGIDFIQGLFAIRYFLDRPTHGLASRRELVPKALEILLVNYVALPDNRTPKAASIMPHSFDGSATIAQMKVSRSPQVLARHTLNDRENTIVREALQLAYAAETIVLLEYYEVIVPLLNCVFIVVAMQFQAALYNTKLRGFNLDAGKLSGAVTSILLYSLLQGLSCVAMHLVMKYRYGVSASSLLAFVLERYKRAIQAKMIAWLPLILHFSTVHYGTDFSFAFAFDKWVQW